VGLDRSNWDSAIFLRLCRLPCGKASPYRAAAPLPCGYAAVPGIYAELSQGESCTLSITPLYSSYHC
jgi:hypothetical protein